MAVPCLLVAVVLALTACDPILHPDIAEVVPASGPLRVVMVSADGTGALVSASAPDGVFTEAGLWHLNRSTGAASQLPTSNQTQYVRISADGDRVLQRTGSIQYVWTLGTWRQAFAGTVMSADLRFGAFRYALGALNVGVWDSATGGAVDVEQDIPRPAEFPSPGSDIGVSDDGSVVWFKLSGPTGCIARFVNRGLGRVDDHPYPCGDAVKVSANGATLVRPLDPVTYPNGHGGATRLELVDVIGHETKRTVTATIPGAFFQEVVIARTGWNLWTLETTVSEGLRPTATARGLVVASPTELATYPVDPGLARNAARSVPPFATEAGGRFLWYTATDGSAVHVVDRLTGTDELIQVPEPSGLVGVGNAFVSDDGQVVTFQGMDAAGARRGWFEARPAPPPGP